MDSNGSLVVLMTEPCKHGNKLLIP